MNTPKFRHGHSSFDYNVLYIENIEIFDIL